jgi:hypothetical protein
MNSPIQSTSLNLQTHTVRPVSSHNPETRNKVYSAPSVDFSQPIRDSVHFQGNSKSAKTQVAEQTDTKKIETEKEKIAVEIKRLGANPSLLVQLMGNQTFAARAEYNVTDNRDTLNALTPYRKKYVQNNDQESLRQYDAIVDKIMDQAEFHYSQDNEQFKDAALAVYPKSSLPAPLLKPVDLVKQVVTKTPILLSHRYTNHYFHQEFEKRKEQGRQIPDGEIQSLLKNEASPLNDNSSRYLIASGIAELIHRKPEFIEQALKQNSQHPLRFVLSDGQLVLGNQNTNAGDTYVGFNMIQFSKPHIWAQHITGSGLTPPHEFIHLLSEGSDMDDLPVMTDEQKARFHEIRSNMEKEYRKKDNHLTKRMDQEQITALGLRQYTFRNRQEFLAETIEVFLMKPEVLRQTESGRELYDFYKELLGIDPAKDFPQRSAE